MKKYRILSVFMLAAALAFSGCLQKNPTQSDAIPQFPTIVNFQGPASQNVPAELQGYVDILNAQTSAAFSYLTLARLQTPKTDGNTTTWTITSGQLTVTITAVKDGDSADWTFELNGTDQNKNTYDHLKLMSGTSSMDGKSGTMHIFDESSKEAALFEWLEENTGKKDATITIYGSPDSKYELVNNPDHSGSVDAFEGSVKIYHAVWNSNGAGSWEKYDASGTVADSGSWN